MIGKSKKYLEAYLWLLEAKSGKWYKINSAQEKILKDINRNNNSPFLPELTFHDGEIKITRWKNGKPVIEKPVEQHIKKFGYKNGKK